MSGPRGFVRCGACYGRINLFHLRLPHSPGMRRVAARAGQRAAGRPPDAAARPPARQGEDL